MRPLLTSALAFLIMTGLGAQAFGRFGYSVVPVIPGFSLDKAGFRAKQPRADRLTFAAPAEQWKPIDVSSVSTTYALGGKNRAPSKLRVNLLAPGFELYFANGFSLDVSTLQGPYLTWADASIGPPNPTPEVPWVALSFSDAQPPILLSFEGKSCGVRITGKSGQWRIENATAFQGWVRVALPLGIVPMAATEVSQLGTLAQAVKSHDVFWNRPAPQIVSTSIKEDIDSLTATWTYDRPGVLVSTGLLLANLGGYSPTITSITRRIEAPTEEGPISYCIDSKLVVRFPIRRIPSGRSLTVGEAPSGEIGALSPFDISSVVRLALMNLIASGDDVAFSSADGILSDYLLGARYEEEPITGQKMPFEVNGKGLDAASAQALLTQALQLSRGVQAEPNSVLTSVLWLLDPASLRLWSTDALVARRSGALAAIACALSADPNVRLQGALLESGIAAERGLGIWKLDKRWEKKPLVLIEPLQGLRDGLFFADTDKTGDDPFTLSLLSEVRLMRGPGLSATQTGNTATIKWAHKRNPANPMVFASGFPIAFSKGKNIKSIETSPSFGLTVLSYEPESRGECQIGIQMPIWARPLPKTVTVPSYSEPAH